MYHITCDTHTHTFYSRHAFSTIEENVRAAHDEGMELLGSTDHYGSMLWPGEPDIRNYQYFLCVGMWPRRWHGVYLLRGCEADIIDLKGHLFGSDVKVKKNIVNDRLDKPTRLDKEVFRDLDYVIASIHYSDFTKGASIKETTRMYLGALENPKVLVLGHIGRAGVPFDVDTVVKAARDANKLIEVNEHSFGVKPVSKEACKKIIVRCAELGCSISLGTDAHIATDIGRFDKTLALLSEVDFPEELIASRNKDSFLAAVEKAGTARA